MGSSRSSLTGVGFMPVIAENEVAQTPPSPTNAVFGNGSHSGSPPLRIPLKNPRRASPASMSHRRGLPPPYVPPYILAPPTLHHPPPIYTKEDAEIAEQESSQTAERSGRRKLADRWCCILGMVVALLVVIAVGLAIGLTIGLKDQHDQDHDGSSSSSGDSESSDQSFPAGSFAFEVHLQETSTNCTSNPSTWRCYPYSTGDSATFFWIITAHSSSFTISSTDNPFAPTFTDRPLTVLDAGKSTERLRFSFSMTKSVVPSDKLTANNRAASCTFADTVFEATLWTRRRGNTTLAEGESEPADVKFGDWPRNAEIVQRKDYELGQPKCMDSDGSAIADVQAESGTCSCQYANFGD